ncbi:MAG TPA: hypothetical protein VD862_04265 [Candidatus Paceibacterota bacterium]|nr:hypothetical protein [Candidatus Paceibacterota bacterium]
MNIRRGAYALALILSAACGHDRSPAGPTGSLEPGPPAGPPEILSGRTGAPVTADVVRQGSELTVTAGGFLTLRTTDRGQTVWLWPDDAELPVRWTRAFSYRGSDGGQLRRPAVAVRAVAVTPSADIRNNGDAYDALVRGTELVSAVGELPEYGVDVSGAGMAVTVTVDAGDDGFRKYPNAAGIAYTQIRDDGVIISARIVFRHLDRWHGWDNFAVAVAHELAHTFGLDHLEPSGPSGIMSASTDTYRFRDFQPHERLIMSMHSRRLPGTRLSGVTEDERRGVMQQSLGSRWELVCAF